jgi:2-desacetyl-2-hydroxyethyl bacteriochlorophyllide A dehydrogenase
VRALRLHGPRQAALVDVDDPSPGAGEVVVHIEACGVCGSDLNAWRGVPGLQYPLPPGAPGHEVVGTVVGLGPDVHSPGVGQTVTGLMWNGFAELGTARAEDLVEMPAPLAGSGLLGEPLACAMNVVRRSAIGAGDRLAVVGFGYLAALLVQLLPRSIGGWVALSRRADSRELALRLGAEAAYDFSDVPAELWDSFGVVIEAAGVQQTLDYATWLTADGGRLVIAGYHADGPRSVNMQSWNWKGIDVINAHERKSAVSVRALREALALAEARQLKLERLQTHAWPLAQAAEAFRCAEERPSGFVKGVVRP